MPLAARLLLGLAVVALGGVILSAGTGQLGRIVAGFGTAFGGIVDQVGATPTPTPTEAPPIPAPVLVPPAEGYTNQQTIDLTGSVPGVIAGNPDYRIKVYLTLPDQPPTLIQEVPVGASPQFTVPGVPLVRGANEFTATIAGPVGESKPSATARYVYDISKPKVTITSPEDGSTVNAKTVEMVGKTQGRSKLIARNEANNASITGAAATDGSFTLTLPIESGPNGITITATDPAGNVGSLVISVLRGSGELTAKLTASGYRFQLSNLPRPITFTTVVTDPDGHPLEGATVTFSVSIPGLPSINKETISDGTGTATFDTTVPEGSLTGTGIASVFVTTSDFGTTSARAVFTIVE